MDYTTSANVKAQLAITLTTDDSLIAACVTRASRMIDRYLTGAPNSDNYLLSETKTGELLMARYAEYSILTYPRKPLITALTSFEYRLKPYDTWTAGDSDHFDIGGAQATLYKEITTATTGQKVFCRLTYAGGLAADVASLPADIVESATVTAARIYREAKAGLTDVIGVTELGVMVYSKAWPARVKEALQPYVRVVPWAGSI